MSFPQTVRYSTLGRLVFPVILMSLLVIILTLVMLDLVLTLSQWRNVGLAAGRQYYEPNEQVNDERIKALIVEKHVLQANVDECLADKKREILETTEHLREEIEKLVSKNKKQVYGELGKRNKESDNNINRMTADRSTKSFQPNNIVTMSRDLFNYIAASLRDAPYPGVGNYTQYAVARLGLTPLVDVKPLIPEFGPVINDVLSFQYPITIPPCRDHQEHIDTVTNPNPTASVFVAVISATGNFERRKTIRQTWRNHLNEAHRERLLEMAGFAFVLNWTSDKETQQKIEEESKIHGDIIQITTEHQHSSLNAAGLFNWLYSRNCAKVDFVVKVDDDVYVNVRNLAHFIQCDHKPSNGSVFGFEKPANNSPNNWPAAGELDRQLNNNMMSSDEWPWNDEYPPYILGAAIVLISGHSIVPLLAACQTTPVIPFADLYLFGICTEKAGIEVHYSTSPTNRSLIDSTTEAPTTCELGTLIAWRVDLDDFTKLQEIMHLSHERVDSFYRKATQCVMAPPSTNGIDDDAAPDDEPIVSDGSHEDGPF